MKKLKISTVRVILIFIAAALVVLIALYLFTGNVTALFSGKWNIDDNWTDLLLLGGWFVSSAVFLIISVVSNYYIVEKDGVIQVRMFKKMHYRYDDVLYINEEWSKKNKVLLFYTKYGHSRYLTFDKKGEIYDLFLDNCTKLISKEEYQFRFPKIKL